MPTIDTLRFALITGATIGAIIGMLASGPLGASPKGTAKSAAHTASCSSNICENAVWLRAPIRFSAGLAR
jgi:hypothetical protein